MKIAILGSNSFSGASMANYMLENSDNEVIGISRSKEYNPIFLPYLYKKKQRPERFRFHQLDINKDIDKIIGLLDEEKPEGIINFAAQGEVRTSWKYPEQWFQTNCISFVSLTNKLKDRGYVRRFVQASTPEVYGSCPGRIKESFTYRPSTPYAASKAAADLFLAALAENCGFPVVLTRAANVYGAHQQLYRIIPRAIIYLKLGKMIELHNHGLAERAFIHIKDVCNAVSKIISSDKPSLIYHLSPDGGVMPIAGVVRLICEKTGYDFGKSVKMMGKPLGQDQVYELDSSKAREELNWRPAVSFEKGIDEVIQWIEDCWDTIKKQPLEYIHKE